MNSEISPVTAVVVARNEEHRIAPCMRSLARQDYPEEALEVILIDDGSTDRTVEVARRELGRLQVIANPSRSISSNRNRGWRAATHRYVAFLDADCEAPRHWIRTLSAAMDRLQVAAVGGANVPPRGESAHYDALAIMLDTYMGSRDSVQGRVYHHEHEVEHLPGLNVLFDKAALERVGGYDERFARMGEDEDLSRRLRYQGMRLFYIPKARVTHRQRGTLRDWSRNMFAYGRGRVWLLRRHPGALSPSFLVPPLTWPLLPLYAPTALSLAAHYGIRARRPGLIPRLFAVTAATHMAYGAGEIAGLFSAGDSDRARESAGAKKVALIVLKNAGNKGDEAIFLSVCQKLLDRRDRAGGGFEPYVVGFGPSGADIRAIPDTVAGAERLALDIFAPRGDARALSLGRAETWLDGLRLVDVLVAFHAVLFCGGHWIHDLNPAFHAAISSLFGAARACGTRTGVFCVGSGPLSSAPARALVRAAFGRKSLIVARDPASAALYRQLGLGQVRLAADPALDLETGALAGDSPCRGAIGLSPCAWFRFDNVYRRDGAAIDRATDEWVGLCRRLLERGERVALIPTMNPEDRAYCDRIARACGRVAIVDTEKLTPAALQAHIGQLRALVSMRLHPVIFAANAATPFVALNYAPKVAEFCRRIGMAEVLVDLDDPGWGQRAEAALAWLEDHRDAAIATVGRGLAGMRSSLTSAYNLLWPWLEE